MGFRGKGNIGTLGLILGQFAILESDSENVAVAFPFSRTYRVNKQLFRSTPLQPVASCCLGDGSPAPDAAPAPPLAAVVTVGLRGEPRPGQPFWS